MLIGLLMLSVNAFAVSPNIAVVDTEGNPVSITQYCHIKMMFVADVLDAKYEAKQTKEEVLERNEYTLQKFSNDPTSSAAISIANERIRIINDIYRHDMTENEQLEYSGMELLDCMNTGN